jgi:hypothetical protein
MYKITRIKEISTTFATGFVELLNQYINEELQKDEFLIGIKYFTITTNTSTLDFEEPIKAHLIIGKLIN